MISSSPHYCLSQLLRSTYRESRAYFSQITLPSAVRPSTAPKPSIDIKHIYKNPLLHSQNCLNRNYKEQQGNTFKIVELVNARLELQHSNSGLRQRNKKLQGELDKSRGPKEDAAKGSLDGANQPANSDLQSARRLKQEIRQLEAKEDALNAEIEALALELPNLTSSETPIGSQPRVISYVNDLPSSSQPRLSYDHVTIGTQLDLLDFTASSTTSGWGWYYLKNGAALLEQALVQFAIQTSMRHAFTPVSPPSIVYSHIASAAGFRPRDQNGEQQVYALQQADTAKAKPELSLSGTAEIPFAAMKAATEIEIAKLPLQIVGPSRCYRAEAGARGVDTKGLYRVHEFTKVEMFGWTLPTLDAATTLFSTMLNVQTEILRSLGLTCRILEMPSYDLGASAFRKQDVEAFFPSRSNRDGGWGEVTSTSICTDYQTRRLATKVRDKEGKASFPWTVNGTALAVPRVLAALLEMGWIEEEKCVRIPEVLWPWMGGLRVLKKE